MVSESKLHVALKEIVRTRLRAQGFRVFVEPCEPPLPNLAWQFLRPDLVGFNGTPRRASLVVVECETNPRPGRLLDKSRKAKDLRFQATLDRAGSLRFILAVPRGRLSGLIGTGIRAIWETWLIDAREGSVSSVIAKIGA